MLEGLRAALRPLGLTPFDIQLPDEDTAVAPLEGALRVRADDPGFVLETVDYGRAYRPGRTPRSSWSTPSAATGRPGRTTRPGWTRPRG